MAIISFDYGHLEGGQDTSANGYLYEYRVNREYGPVCVARLRAAGHTLIDCTPPNGSCATLSQSLAYRANKANRSGSILHLCFHANSFSDPSAHGTEVEVASDISAKYGYAIVREIGALGYQIRGDGVKRPNLYMTRHTAMPCVLTEVFFVSNKEDCNRYNPTAIGNAIAAGVLNVLGNGSGSAPAQAPTQPQASVPRAVGNDWVARLQAECNRQGFSNQAVDGLPGPNTIAGCPMCRRGARGAITRLLQERLVALGYNTNGVDGIYGSGTVNAVAAFQRNQGLSPDGIAGPNTWRKLLGR